VGSTSYRTRPDQPLGFRLDEPGALSGRFEQDALLAEATFAEGIEAEEPASIAA
jgi:hypothetical protein